ncbi:hypothetical protein [Fusobacterium necrophorum]|uniref:Uncharacterized protein n=1 Tax=Fusobacterium necrophorum TaxID=859 RepID=A0A4Q2KUP8_9FUSO|nr:hypothetical protein [Fusobacterium necrophorum]RXZ68589.1 hypothetical protein EPT53_09250 [Fusobacterium necrophorum]
MYSTFKTFLEIVEKILGAFTGFYVFFGGIAMIPLYITGSIGFQKILMGFGVLGLYWLLFFLVSYIVEYFNLENDFSLKFNKKLPFGIFFLAALQSLCRIIYTLLTMFVYRDILFATIFWGVNLFAFLFASSKFPFISYIFYIIIGILVISRGVDMLLEKILEDYH